MILIKFVKFGRLHKYIEYRSDGCSQAPRRAYKVDSENHIPRDSAYPSQKIREVVRRVDAFGQ